MVDGLNNLTFLVEVGNFLVKPLKTKVNKIWEMGFALLLRRPSKHPTDFAVKKVDTFIFLWSNKIR